MLLVAFAFTVDLAGLVVVIFVVVVAVRVVFSVPPPTPVPLFCLSRHFMHTFPLKYFTCAAARCVAAKARNSPLAYRCPTAATAAVGYLRPQDKERDGQEIAVGLQRRSPSGHYNQTALCSALHRHGGAGRVLWESEGPQGLPSSRSGRRYQQVAGQVAVFSLPGRPSTLLGQDISQDCSSPAS